MKAWVFSAVLSLAAVSVLAPIARADGPRPSSENHWPGMSDTAPGMINAPVAAAQLAPPVAPPHYVWQEGYENGGRWHGHWVVVQ